VARVADAAAAAEAHVKSFHHGVTYTSYEGNAFAVKFNTTGGRAPCLAAAPPPLPATSIC
jgi:hypothetical protein